MRGRREKVKVMWVVRGGEWNVGSSPAAVSIRCALVIEHDVESGEWLRSVNLPPVRIQH